jgi:hypothetical protein
LIVLAVGAFVAFAPLLVPDAFGGPRIAGWSLMATLPVGMIIGLMGIIGMAVGTKSESETDDRDSAADEETSSAASVDGSDVAKPVGVTAPTQTPRVLSPEFGRRQIVLMGGVFLLLQINIIIRLAPYGKNWAAMAGLPFELPNTLGVLVAGALFVVALRLRFNASKTWSADAYDTLYRAQRAFTIPAYASVLLFGVMNPVGFFDTTDVGSAAGILRNQIAGITWIAPPVIAIAASVVCSRWRRKFLEESEAAQT